MLQTIILMAVVAILPLVLFLGLVSLAILIWSWGRIGRYFVNFGRWMGDWRNFVPLASAGTLMLLFIFFVTPLFLPSTLRLILIVPLILTAFICSFFALIAWTLMAGQWLWLWYRKEYWRRLASVVSLIWVRSGDKAAKVPSRASGHKIMRESPSVAQVPKKRSWLGTFWDLLLGKPSKRPKPRPRPVKIQTREQSLGLSDSEVATEEAEDSLPAATIPSLPRPVSRTPPKGSWFATFWSLMLGRPAKSGKPKRGFAKVKNSEQAARPSETIAAATAKTGATARVDEATTTPQRAKKEKPAKRGFFAGIWMSIVRGVTFVVGLVFLGVVWVVQKMREGIEWIRVRLNLD